MLNNLYSGTIFLKFFALGVGIGLGGLIVQLFCKLFKRNIIITNTANFCYYSAQGIVFCSFLFKLAGGALSFYMVLGTTLGVAAQKITLSKLFTNVGKLVYNAFIKWLTKGKGTKLGAKMLK